MWPRQLLCSALTCLGGAHGLQAGHAGPCIVQLVVRAQLLAIAVPDASSLQHHANGPTSNDACKRGTLTCLSCWEKQGRARVVSYCSPAPTSQTHTGTLHVVFGTLASA